MINYISTWASQIITAVIVVTILEMILPKGNSKKYIKTIIGIYIVYTIISPAIKLIKGKEIKIDTKTYEKYFGTQEANTNLEVPSIEETYQKELEKKLKQYIEALGYNVEKEKAEINLEKGNITKIELEVNKKQKKEKAEIDVSVNKIEIGNIKKENVLEEAEIENIKQKIKEDYGIEKENITINSK